MTKVQGGVGVSQRFESGKARGWVRSPAESRPGVSGQDGGWRG